MRIGVDFDNTIVNYDQLFYNVAREWGVIPPETPVNKVAIRNLLRSAGQEDRWTEMQGYVYGPRMDEAVPYPGAIEFLSRARAAGHAIAIVSHKTRYPFLGPQYDLHDAARRWVAGHLVADGAPILSEGEVFFELTKEEKLARIRSLQCDAFIDDLPEILLSEQFPSAAQRLLFDPEAHYDGAQSNGLKVLRSWSEAAALVADTSAELRDQVKELLADAGFRESIQAITCSSTGGNNRVYQVITERGSSFAVKHYFRHDLDARDRMSAEYAFLTYAASAAPGTASIPYASNRERGIALYEFVAGRRLRPEEIGWPRVRAAISFFRALNDPRHRARAASLPSAAESCFSIREHLDLVRGRIRALSDLVPALPVDHKAAAFCRTLASFWRTCASDIQRSASEDGLDKAAPLDRPQQCISPSDFGFHNALLTVDDTLRFIDFEYAGWDDPAKTVGDFFAQLAVPVPQQYFDAFVTEIMDLFPDSEQFVRRARLLRPVYQIKWCCIALNVFLPVHMARRKFADPILDEKALKEAQLEKAERLFQALSVGVNR